MSETIRWPGSDGLLPAIVQHAESGEVLMLGYMNEEALAATRASGRVTFFSRSRQRLWVKGETSGHFLELEAVAVDCDGDALLVLARPSGPVCHRGSLTCWGDAAPRATLARLSFLASLERIIAEREKASTAASYSARLLAAGPTRVAQKVGEEAVELALAAVTDNDERVLAEAADLIYHLLLLLRARNLTLAEVTEVLASRHQEKTG